MLSADSYQNSHSLFSACLCVGSISVCNTSNPSHLFNLMAPYFDTSSNDKKTILPLKNFTPAHWFRIQPAHCFTKHKLIFFSLSLSLSPAQLHLLQSIVTAAWYQSTQGQPSLFAITVASKALAKLQARRISMLKNGRLLKMVFFFFNI